MNEKPKLPDPPNALAALENLVGILTAIREEQVSTKMGFGTTPAEKKQRADVYAAEIARRAAEVDDALEYAEAALTKTKEDVAGILKGIDDEVLNRVAKAVASPRPTEALNPDDRHPFVDKAGWVMCGVCGKPSDDPIHVQQWERG